MQKIVKKIKENNIFVAITLVLVACVFQVIGNGYFDTDFFHIATTGRWIVENKAVPYVNENFALEGYGTIAQQWLYSIFLYGAYAVGSKQGVFLFVLLQMVAFSFTVYKFFEIKGLNREVSIIAVLIILLIFSSLNCRPELLTGMLLTIQLCVVEQYKKNKNAKMLYILPLLTLLEINVHCTYWIFHFIFLMPYLVPLIKALKNNTQITDSAISVKPFVLPMVLMTASLFVNPYGIKGIMCLFWSQSISQLNILELASVKVFSVDFLLIACAMIALILLYRNKQLASTTLYFVFGLSLAYLFAIKNRTLFALCCMFLIANMVNSCTMSQVFSFLKQCFRKAPATCLALVIVVACVFNYNGNTSFTANMQELAMPEQVVEYLKKNEGDLDSIKLFTTFNDGAYFTWNGIKNIYMQAKTEPYLAKINEHEDIIEEYKNISRYGTDETIASLLEKYNFDYLFVPYDCNGLQTYLDLSSDYACVLASENHVKESDANPVLWKLYKKYS